MPKPDSPTPLVTHGLALALVAASGTIALAQAASTSLSSEARARIEAALPRQAVVRPQKPRRLLIFDLNVGYGGHGSIPYANYALRRMGDLTQAFEAVVSRDPAVFAIQTLKSYDAVFFNNTVGNLFVDPALRQSLLEFVYGGGGLLGLHGTSVAFTRWPGAHEDWPEFGILLGARGANHRDSDELVFVKLDDPGHPLNSVFGGHGFEFRDEFFRVHEPYSRSRVRVLLSIDTARTDMDQGAARGQLHRDDDDYAVAWVRQYGRGRAFYSTIAHNPYVFWDERMLKFYLAAVQFALGDLPAPTLPSQRLTAPVRAQEQLGWRFGYVANTAAARPCFEAIDQASLAGLAFVSCRDSLPTAPEIAKPFGPSLDDDELRRVRLKLDSAGIRLLGYHVSRLPKDAAGWRDLFEFGRKMGVEVFVVDPNFERWDTLEALCDAYDIKLAWRCSPGPATTRPLLEEVLEACAGRSPRMGVAGDVAEWARAGLEPAAAVELCGERLHVLQLGPRRGIVDPDSSAELWQWVEGSLQETLRRQIRPVMFEVGPAAESGGAAFDGAQFIRRLNALSVKLAQSTRLP